MNFAEQELSFQAENSRKAWEYGVSTRVQKPGHKLHYGAPEPEKELFKLTSASTEVANEPSNSR